MRPIIHPGFGHSGTTSLQRKFFSRRPDLFYCGDPYGRLGGIFSWIKYQDEQTYDRDLTRRHCEKLIFSKLQPGQRIVVSDESMVDQTEVYYTPALMPVTTIAQRLKEFFPDATILFTIRNQYDYVTSTYLNLKRNYARLANRPIEDFTQWFEGQFTQVRNLFLRNLDYSRAISAYISQFGRDSVRVVPLEAIARSDTAAYLSLLGRELDLEIRQDDIEAFASVQNRRVSVLEDRILTHWPDPAFRDLYANLEAQIGKPTLDEVLAKAPRTVIELTRQQRRVVSDAARRGNVWLEKEFGLRLKALGYPR